MRTEVTFSIVFLIGLLFKFFGWPASGIFLIISLISLSCIYFFGAFYFFCDKIIKKSNIALSIISGFLLSIIPIGILFKIQNWPGATINLLSGIITGFILIGVVLFLKAKASSELTIYYRNMVIRIIVLTALSIIFYLI